MIQKVVFLSVPFIIGCCLSHHGHTCAKPKFRTETGVNAKFDPYNEAKPVSGVEASWKFVKEW